MPSINVLKSHILSLIRPEKRSTFDIHDPLGLRYLFYLRLGLSPLRSHKNHHSFVDTPFDKCICNHGIENTNHFLFLCSLYSTQRAPLIAIATEILQKYSLETLVNRSRLYLYGHKAISFADNRKIILSTIDFIKETQRFSA